MRADTIPAVRCPLLARRYPRDAVRHTIRADEQDDLARYCPVLHGGACRAGEHVRVAEVAREWQPGLGLDGGAG